MSMRLETRTQLIQHFEAGGTAQFTFFWGHTQKKAGVADRSCFSQWFLRAFTIAGVTYSSAEHWMMAEKARLFSDADSVQKVLNAQTPAEAKELGRAVKNYEDSRWAAKRFAAVVEGNVAKFSQHSDLRDLLLATGDSVLVEAAPRDTVWGIGLSAANPRAGHPSTWRGENLLGFALMKTRTTLRNTAEPR